MHFLNFSKELSFPINFFDVIEDVSRRSALLKRKNTTLKIIMVKMEEAIFAGLEKSLENLISLKNPISQTPQKVDDFVLIEGDIKNKFLWKLGKFQRAIPGLLFFLF